MEAFTANLSSVTKSREELVSGDILLLASIINNVGARIKTLHEKEPVTFINITEVRGQHGDIRGQQGDIRDHLRVTQEATFEGHMRPPGDI